MPNEEKIEEINRMWKVSEKRRMNISIPTELADWLDNNASSNWKLDKAARSKEVTKILKQAKETEEAQIQKAKQREEKGY
jgi:RPA family protein